VLTTILQFGRLSTDCEVLPVSRIGDLVHAGEVDKRSVVPGVVTIARCVASAGLIMVFVFGQAGQLWRVTDDPRFVGPARQSARGLAPGSVA
jgi:hypothetical protein